MKALANQGVKLDVKSIGGRDLKDASRMTTLGVIENMR